jgi:adenylate cyclase
MSRVLKAMILGVLTGLLGVTLSLLPPGANLEENVGLDLLFKLRGVRKAPSEVVIVSVDKASADQLQVPADPRKWPRSLHARLTDILARERASVIAFDVFFDEARPVVEDVFFAKSIQKAGNVVLCEGLEMDRVSLQDREKGTPGELTIVKLMPPTPSLARSAVALAPFPLPKVPVKVSQYWTFKTGAGDTPTLPVVAFQVYALEVYAEFVGLMERVAPSLTGKFPSDREEIAKRGGLEKLIQDIREIFESDISIGEKMSQELQKRASSSQEFKNPLLLKSLIKMYQSVNSPFLNFYGPPGTIPTIPYDQVLRMEEKVPPAPGLVDFRGKAVFIGLSERVRPGQKDGFYTAFSQSSGLDISGVEIAATAFSNLLADKPIGPLGSIPHLFLVFFWGMMIGTTLLLLPALLAAGTTIVLSLLYLFFASHQFNAAATWYPVLLPLLIQFPLAFFGAVLWRYVDSNKERQNIRKAFGYYLPNGVIDQLSRNIAHIKTSRQLVYGICLSTDAEHYTSLSEAMNPKELGDFMNRYYETVFRPIKERHGIVANVIGDSVLALWVASHPDTLLKKEACHAALDIADAVHQFNRSSGPFQLPTRIGLHSGHILLSHMGAMDHYEYRPVGDIVNTATRVEGLNKYLGTRLLASEEVIHQLEGFVTRELGAFLFAGKSKPLGIYGLLGRPEDVSESQQQACLIFTEALAAFRKQAWNEAIERFHQSIGCFGEDGPSQFYIKVCNQYKKNPPAEGWNGVVQMDQK